MTSLGRMRVRRACGMLSLRHLTACRRGQQGAGLSGCSFDGHPPRGHTAPGAARDPQRFFREAVMSVAWGVLSVLLGGPGLPAEPVRHPNVLLIVTHDQGH